AVVVPPWLRRLLERRLVATRRSIGGLGLCRADGRQPHPTGTHHGLRRAVYRPAGGRLTRAALPIPTILCRAPAGRRAREFDGRLFGALCRRSRFDGAICPTL